MKTFVVQFVGGRWGGQALRGDALNVEEAKLAKKCYWITDAGTVGARFCELSSEEMRYLRKHASMECGSEVGHEYVVADRMETNDEVRVKLTLYAKESKQREQETPAPEASPPSDD